MQNKSIILVLAIVMLFGFGCARTVTSIVDYGDHMIVDVTLRGTLEVETNRYFMVLSSIEGYKVALPPPDIIENAPEFLEPGMTPELGSAEAYYANFYLTWSGYIIVDPGGYSTVKGPFASNLSISREVFSTLGETKSKIVFTFQLSDIFGAAVPDRIYFDLVSVPWPVGQAKIPADHLPSPNNYISKISGSVFYVDDGENSSLDAGLDILGCSIRME
ncbi:hypothetical protein A3J44_06700 [candidate division WOR-1 bacterium RIFCSPHIGHO2_02_FULL_45_12]|uniref:Uncharacterized protein n=1 Tax=candidate division WOR-1 bacterium RIFCSPLOWO2_12_FULL_45_9 TaxID=1802568 RepID=A0A1F4RNY2_UNCSA|nr:MAG: hypothetical protein A3J44_06700 [candidate division WOR-1 bacterium RIFCSPHIGHO2_02_FULL_45_12]OGC09836.1 MAG: hypothetical protein A3F86_04045 [candidate division WOR-1 bacterium RIFCSPLOWO2_12_FULL_45_9]